MKRIFTFLPHLVGTSGYLGAVLIGHFLLDVGRNRGVSVKYHRVRCSSLGHGAQIRYVLEHFRKGNHRSDDLDISSLPKVLHLSSSGIEVSKNISHIVFGGNHLHLHKGLHQLRSSFPYTLFEGSSSCNFKGQNGGIHVVVRSIKERSTDVQHRESSQYSIREFTLQTLDDSRYVFLRNRSSLDFIHKLKVGLIGFIRLDQRLKLDTNSSELSTSARLLLMRIVNSRLPGNTLPVCDLRGTDVAFHLELSLHPVDNDFQVKLTHTLDNSLIRLLVTRESEGGIFLSELNERRGHLLLVSLGLGLHCNLNNWIWEVHTLEDNRVIRIA
mmetsp:Transcript_1321/g.2759  ORF Transcript_1321/g.2759 Transcript_1321/m.2759 type:complete len:327 (+) Transcript_1321:2346-3326(+)